LPAALYSDRTASLGLELSDVEVLEQLQKEIDAASATLWQAAPLLADGQDFKNNSTSKNSAVAVCNPADHRQQIGEVVFADLSDVHRALDAAPDAARQWNQTPVAQRAACLERSADLLEKHSAQLIAMCIREGGKTIADAVAEIREAVDFCRYYAVRARADFTPQPLPGPTGEQNQIQLQGRGVFVCISPWNFPLAIFIGQISAALAAGNAVLAKPAEQTPLIAAAALELLYQAGVPRSVLQFLPGGAEVGAALVNDARVAGVAFTGSTETAWAINRSLAARNTAIAALIAETGGQNVMLVDSSALLEQVVADVLHSGFQSAGQRCSALRVLLVQQDIAPRLLEMLSGAMAELKVGDPASLATDVGPIIDRAALQMLRQHAGRMDKEARLIYSCRDAEEATHGTFFPPCLYEISSLAQLQREVFGPVVHVMRYRASELDEVVEAINATGYGLTFGIHSRIDTTVRSVLSRIRAGNVYVNRNMIGAMVGVQPFGGNGLSGTGPKAGGPYYLHRFATEQTITINTTAAGGNASLMSMQEEQSVQTVQTVQESPVVSAQEADREKDEFLATLAHELRNPLAAISLGLHVLEGSKDDPARIAQMAEMIQRQSGQLKRLIDDVSDVGRISRGRLQLNRKPVDLVELLHTAIENARSFCAEQGVLLEAALPDTEIIVEGDPVRLVQTAGNVLHNAARFTERGGRITVTMVREDQHVLVSISDTGMGIPPDQLERIFNMFTQVRSSSMRAGGLGIGLALAKTVMEMHNGSIEARSEGLGKGSQFLLRLPVL
jgi:delta-1-pyrroline-5-carboxylate dehydrogenase PutA-like protein